jgi:hypothetical protein
LIGGGGDPAASVFSGISAGERVKGRAKRTDIYKRGAGLSRGDADDEIHDECCARAAP